MECYVSDAPTLPMYRTYVIYIYYRMTPDITVIAGAQ